MKKRKFKYYPTIFDAVHLLVLYLVIQSVIDFPLALYDYHHDTNWLSNSWIGGAETLLTTLFIYFYGYKKSKAPFKEVFAIKLFNPLMLLPIIIILPSMQFLITYLNAEVQQLLPTPPWFWELFERVLNNRFGFWGTVFKVAILAPIIEEILFRGIIMRGLMKNYRGWYAVFMSGLLFSLFHLNPWQMTYTFFLGLLLGWIVLKTKSLPLAIITHSINNLMVILSMKYESVIRESAIFNLPEDQKIKLASVVITTGIVLILIISFYFKPGFFQLKRKMKSEVEQP